MPGVRILAYVRPHAAVAAGVIVLITLIALVGVAVLPGFVFPARSVGRRRKAIRRQSQAGKADMTGS